MANTSPSVQSKRFGIPVWLFFFLPCLALGVLIFFLEYTYSNKHGDLIGSMLYAIAIPLILMGALMEFFVGIIEARRTHVTWYQQIYILIGILFLSMFLVYSVILINSLTNNGLPDAVGLPIAGVAVLFGLFAFVRFIIVRRAQTGRKREQEMQ